MKDKLNDHAHRLKGQPMFQLLDRARQLEQEGRSIIHFEIGDPDFQTPKIAIDSCIKSLKNGDTHYTSSFGLQELREAIAEYTKQDMGFSPDINQILVSPGANALIYFVIQCLVKPDEEVIVPDPAFSTYYSVLNFLNIKTVRVPLREENCFRLNLNDLRQKITSKTKLIIINSPHNPTGSVMTQKEMEGLYDLAEAHDLFILSDEIYRLLSYEIRPFSPAVRDRCRRRTIVMTGFSKSFAMTGWRLGYMIAPEFLVENVSLLLQTIVSCVPPFIQKAGIAILKDRPAETLHMIEELKLRRDVIVAGLNKLPGVSCLNPEGAFYVFPNIIKTRLSSQQFVDLMLEEGGVALVAGPNFGEFAEGYVRLCFATSVENIEEGLRRMESVLHKNTAPAITVNRS